jgi:hypothetical protein
MTQESRDLAICLGGEAGERTCCAGRGEVRCGCGSLLARVVAGSVELKCRRCKRTWNIPITR